MGMYSTFENQEIEVVNVKVLEKLKKLREDKNLGLYNLIDEDGHVHFEEWDGHKLEGYWYKETFEVLKAISPFITGMAEFTYEKSYKFRIIFKKGEVFVQKEIIKEPIWDKPINISTIQHY